MDAADAAKAASAPNAKPFVLVAPIGIRMSLILGCGIGRRRDQLFKPMPRSGPWHLIQIKRICQWRHLGSANSSQNAMKKVGNEGVITVEEAELLETELEVVESMQFDRGYISPYFVTIAEKMRLEMDDTYVLINEKKLSQLNDCFRYWKPWCRAAIQLKNFLNLFHPNSIGIKRLMLSAAHADTLSRAYRSGRHPRSSS